ncbi:MAG: transporter [Synechococcaceae bacterium WB8_1B_136]|nr:transporter [Synechococcaceae bacterium WB8_1B_136]
MTLSPGLLVSLTLFFIMLALGVSLRAEALQQWRLQPGLLLRVLLGSCVLVPLVALVLLQTPWSTSLQQPARFAIALMALSPSAPLTLRKAGKAGGDRQLAALLQVSAAVAAILTIPLLGAVFKGVFAIEGWNVQPLDVALQVGRAQLLPLVLGLLLRQALPRLADRIEGPLDKLANLLLLLLVVVVLVKAGPLLLAFIPQNLPALLLMALMVLIALAIGYAMAGTNPSERTTTALVTSMRNPGLALLFASTHGQGMAGVKLGILLYLLLTVLVSVPFLRWRKGQAV